MVNTAFSGQLSGNFDGYLPVSGDLKSGIPAEVLTPKERNVKKSSLQIAERFQTCPELRETARSTYIDAST